jgi:hypothetical protein
MPPVSVEFPGPNVVQLRSSALLRQVGVRLKWMKRSEEAVSDDEFVSILEVENVRSLDAKLRPHISMEQWRTLVQHPAFANVTEISATLMDTVHVAFTSLLSTLPNLRQLDFKYFYCDLPFECLDALPSLPALTSFHVQDNSSGKRTGILHLQECANLRHLSLQNISDDYIEPIL